MVCERVPHEDWNSRNNYFYFTKARRVSAQSLQTWTKQKTRPRLFKFSSPNKLHTIIELTTIKKRNICAQWRTETKADKAFKMTKVKKNIFKLKEVKRSRQRNESKRRKKYSAQAQYGNKFTKARWQDEKYVCTQNIVYIMNLNTV